MIKVIGWDIGGAHLKAAAADNEGRIVAVAQHPCPLWQGMDYLNAALQAVLEQLRPDGSCRHAVTMTGELVDLFANRADGVMAIAEAVSKALPGGRVSFFAGFHGWVSSARLAPGDAAAVASANWLASGFWVAKRLPEALLIDIGSTTADLVPVAGNSVQVRGYADHERMRYDELVYTGVLRTPVMALASRVPLNGGWVSLMAEHFATTADVYRLTGDLAEQADQWPAADGGPKTHEGSRRRLARLVGCDLEFSKPAAWDGMAAYLKEHQLARVNDAARLQFSRGLWDATVPLVGAGVGRFLVKVLAARLALPYFDFGDLFPVSTLQSGFCPADCAPAAALAGLAVQRVGPDDAEN